MRFPDAARAGVPGGEGLRAALRKEMGWSDIEVEDFITEHGLAASPAPAGLDAFDGRCRFCGRWAVIDHAADCPDPEYLKAPME